MLALACPLKTCIKQDKLHLENLHRNCAECLVQTLRTCGQSERKLGRFVIFYGKKSFKIKSDVKSEMQN